MSFWQIIDSILFQPLQLIFEILYMLANRIIDNPGLSIIALSLMMNFLVLPLYMRADALQEEEKQTEARMHKTVAHIKKCFKGDEKMMMLQTCYRQNNYKPTDVLKSATSLLLEIPFFIAAYRFLSGLSLLEGVKFGPIADLSQPDGLITIAGFSINILPIIMTAVNLVSCIIFTKDSPLKTKIQLYAMAVFFLFFLYTSPSGLVFYWTLNNVFSLVKTIFYKLKNPGKVLRILASVVGVAFFVYGFFFYPSLSTRRAALFAVLAIGLQIPLIWSLVSKKLPKKEAKEAKPNMLAFVLGGLFLSVLTGAIIPSAVIKSSPQEFVDLTYYLNPNWYIVSAFCLALGIFVLWFGVFYRLAEDKTKVLFEKLIWILCGVFTVDYMAFGNNLGILSNSLQFESGLSFTRKEQLINIAILIGIIAVFFLIFKFLRKYTVAVTGVCLAALIGMSIFNVVGITKSVSEISDQATKEGTNVSITLSKDEQNVIVIMLDRGMGEYIPYIMNEKPELLEKFDGFTYYENMVSHGGSTNFTTPSLFGGYEYTPTELNARSDESLKDKQNEALKVMPTLFSNEGMDVTVINPVYAGYQFIPDISIYDDVDNVSAYRTAGAFLDTESKKQALSNNMRNFFCYSAMKVMPLTVQPVIYENGYYCSDKCSTTEVSYTTQAITSPHTASGYNKTFMDAYNMLVALPELTEVNKGKGNFLMMVNDATHEPTLLSEPDYVPAEYVDNTLYDAENEARFTLNGQTLDMSSYNSQISSYQVNVAALTQLGNWFDYLRESGAYDNTKIVICSDHGSGLYHLGKIFIDDNQHDDWTNVERYMSLLMVKDFNATGFETNKDFMTSADVPSLAMEGIISNPVNPFTGNKIDTAEKTAHPQYVIVSGDWDTEKNNGNTFLPARWFTVEKDVRDTGNWKFIAADAVLTNEEYKK